MKRIFVLCFLFLSSLLFGQIQNPNWALYNSYLHFSSSSPWNPGNLIQYPSSVEYPGFSNSYTDANGNPVFFIIGGNVYNQNFEKKGSLFHATLQWINPTGEIAVVPDYSNCQRFYLFYNGEDWFDEFNLFYSIIDLSLNNCLVTNNEGGTAFILKAGSAAKQNFTIAASKVRGDKNRFIFAYGGDNLQGVYKFTLTPNGLITNPSEILPNTNGISFGDHSYTTTTEHSELELYQISSGGVIGEEDPIDPSKDSPSTPQTVYRLAGEGRDPYFGTYVWEMELDIYGNFITNSFLCQTTRGQGVDHKISGIEFSPNGKYLYFSHEVGGGRPDPVECIDLSPSPYCFALLYGSIYDGLEHAQIELGCDGKLYFAADGRLSTLSYPNNPDANNYIDDAGLGDPLSNILPDQIDEENYLLNQGSHLTADFTADYSCVDNHIVIEVSTSEPSIFLQQWTLMDANGGEIYLTDWENTSFNSFTFPLNLQPNTIYKIKHEVIDFCNVHTWKEKTLFTEENLIGCLPGLKPDEIDDYKYHLCAINEVPDPNVQNFYSIERINPTQGGYMSSDDNPLWLNDPRTCCFEGYNTDPDLKGVFYYGFTYQLIHKTWSGCNPLNICTLNFTYYHTPSEDILITSNDEGFDNTHQLIGSTNQSDFSIYPNPVREKFMLSSKMKQNMDFEIIGTDNRIVFSASCTESNDLVIDVSSLQPGLYFVKNNYGVVKKFVVIK